MRIMFVITELSPAGAEKILSLLACYCQKKGSVCKVIVLMPPPSKGFTSVMDKLEEAGVELEFLYGKSSLTALIPLIGGIYKAIKKFAPDLIHAHLIHPSLLCRLACLFNKIPLVNTIHIAERRKGKNLFFLLDRLTLFRCDAYTAVSEAAACFQEEKCHLPKGKIIVISNGSDPVLPASEERICEKKELWGLSGCHFLAGAAGRLDQQKGYDLFLESIPYIAPKLPPGKKYGFLFMGEGPQGEYLREKAEVLNGKYPNIKIVFPGFQADAASLLAMLDLFLMPSRYEGYGLALAEAFSLGLPALSSKADSLPEVCGKFPGHFLYCTPEKAEETAEKFLQALSLTKFEGRIISSTENMCNTYWDLYGKLTGKGAENA